MCFKSLSESLSGSVVERNGVQREELTGTAREGRKSCSAEMETDSDAGRDWESCVYVRVCVCVGGVVLWGREVVQRKSE